MIEYLPWSKKELEKTLNLYQNKFFSILDIELGGACNLSCIYCDTPQKKARSKINLDILNMLANRLSLNWLFICGLGEPTAKQNIDLLLKILNFCDKRNIKCSMFTNLLEINEDIVKYIQKGILYILYKLDTLDEKKMNIIYRTKKGKKILNIIKSLEKYVMITDGCTNISASIVPTKLNENELLSLIEYCNERNFFPLIGDLEYSGKSKEQFEKLKISENDLFQIRLEIFNRFGYHYQVPICPAVIGGIHINHEGYLIVDRCTGLSCHWFWLKEPKIESLMKIDKHTDINNIFRKIMDYRNKKITYIESMLPQFKELPFGGCGGDIKYMLTKYLEIHKTICKD